MSKSRSFTLVEIIVAAAIFSVATIIVFASFYSSVSYQAKTKAVRETTQEARSVMETLSRQIKYSSGIAFNFDNGTLTIMKTASGDATQSYSYTYSRKGERQGSQTNYYIEVEKKNMANPNAPIITQRVTSERVTVDKFDVLQFYPDQQNCKLLGSCKGMQILLVVSPANSPKKEAEKGTVVLRTTVYKTNYSPGALAVITAGP